MSGTSQFHNKRRGVASNDFSMPHWINLSFYSSSKRVGYSTFIPRIKMAPIISRPANKAKATGRQPYTTDNSIMRRFVFLESRHCGAHFVIAN